MYWWFQGMAAVAILLAMGAAIAALAHRFSERPLGGKRTSRAGHF